MRITSFIVVLAWSMAAGAQQPVSAQFHNCKLDGGSRNSEGFQATSEIYRCDEGRIELHGKWTDFIEYGYVYHQQLGRSEGEPYLAGKETREHNKWCAVANSPVPQLELCGFWAEKGEILPAVLGCKPGKRGDPYNDDCVCRADGKSLFCKEQVPAPAAQTPAKPLFVTCHLHFDRPLKDASDLSIQMTGAGEGVVLVNRALTVSEEPLGRGSFCKFTGDWQKRPAPAAQTPAKPPKVTDLHWSGKVWVEGPAAQAQPESKPPSNICTGSCMTGIGQIAPVQKAIPPAEHQVEIRTRPAIKQEFRLHDFGQPGWVMPNGNRLFPGDCTAVDLAKNSKIDEICTTTQWTCADKSDVLLTDENGQKLCWGTLKYSEGAQPKP